MNFAEAAKSNSIFTRTENGAVALNTTGDARVDLFGTIGALRGAEKERISLIMADPLLFSFDGLFCSESIFILYWCKRGKELTHKQARYAMRVLEMARSKGWEE